jgi:sec-independent protein translocase protein TatA
MPFGLQPIHLVVIFVVALLIFGPRRLPEIGRGVGKAINEFRKGTQEMTESLKDEISRPSQEAQAAAGASQVNSMAPQSHIPPSPIPPMGGPSASGAPVAPVATVSASGNFCTNCGSPNPAEARFCNKCGTQLSA